MNRANVKLVIFGWAGLFLIWNITYSLSMRIADLAVSPVTTYIIEHNKNAIEFQKLQVPSELKQRILGATTYSEFLDQLQLAKRWQITHCMQNHTDSVAIHVRKVSPAEWFNIDILQNGSSIAKGLRRIFTHLERIYTEEETPATTSATTNSFVGAS